MKKIKFFSTLGLAAAATLSLFACGKEAEKPVMTFAQFQEAAVDSDVVIKSYVQDFESWWDGKMTLYLQDKDGAVFAHETKCTEEESKEISKGVCVRLEGKKSVWNDMTEVSGGTMRVLKDEEKYVATTTAYEAADFTNDKLKADCGKLFKVTATIEPSVKGEEEVPFLYNWNGAGEVDGSDIYFNVKVGNNPFTFNVRRYLRDSSTDVYKAAKKLIIGFDYELTGYVYMYEGKCQARIIGIKQVTESASVEFDYKDGSDLKEVIIKKGTTVAKPEDPTREGYAFQGWYSDPAFITAFDFTKAVNDDIRIFAKWVAVK